MLCGRAGEPCTEREDEQPSDGLERAGVRPDVGAAGLYKEWWENHRAAVVPERAKERAVIGRRERSKERDI